MSKGTVVQQNSVSKTNEARCQRKGTQTESDGKGCNESSEEDLENDNWRCFPRAWLFRANDSETKKETGTMKTNRKSLEEADNVQDC